MLKNDAPTESFLSCFITYNKIRRFAFSKNGLSLALYSMPLWLCSSERRECL